MKDKDDDDESAFDEVVFRLVDHIRRSARLRSKQAEGARGRRGES